MNANLVQRDIENIATLWGDKQLTVLQQARLMRLCEAAETLASRGGYSAVTMRAVAESAGVGLATVYRYFASKDHLIGEVARQKSLLLIDAMTATPPPGDTMQEKLNSVFELMIDATVLDLNFAQAGVAAMTATTGDARVGMPWHELMESYLAVAIPEGVLVHKAAIAETLGHVFFSIMVGLTSSEFNADSAKKSLNQAVMLVLPPLGSSAP